MAPGLVSTRDVARADWIAPRMRPWGRHGTPVASVVPGGFAAYARVLHPVHDDGDTWLTWADACRESGATPHALMQWTAITPQRLVNRASPNQGGLVPDTLDFVMEHLPAVGDVTHAWWIGWGEFNGGSRRFGWNEDGSTWWEAVSEFVDPDFPVFKLPSREYVLFRGPLDADLGPRGTREVHDPSPSLLWPDDHTWCLATEVDFDSTLVGATAEVVDAILADPRLEAWPVEPGDDLSIAGDRVNGS